MDYMQQSDRRRRYQEAALSSSLAASSALVSENILDSPSANCFSCAPLPIRPQQQQQQQQQRRSSTTACSSPSSDGDTDDGDEKGVAHHSFSPGRISQILSQELSAAAYGNGNDDDDDDPMMGVHPSQYHAYLTKQHRQRRNSHSSSSSNNNNNNNNNSNNVDPATIDTLSSKRPPSSPSRATSDESSLGILASTRKWLADQRVRRQVEALKHAVEEQRRVLSRENLRAQRRGALRKSHSLDTRTPTTGNAAAAAGLSSNPTFRSLMSGAGYGSDFVEDEGGGSGGGVMGNVNMSICGSGSNVEDDDDYVVDESYDESYGSNGAFASCTYSSERPPLSPPSDEIYYEDESVATSSSRQLRQRRRRQEQNRSQEMRRPPAARQSRDEEIIRIGSPHKTYSGEGMSVRLQLIDQIRADLRRSEREERLTIRPEDNDIPFILDPAQLLSVAKKGLPPSVLFSRWTRLYSLLRDGDSFEGSFLRKVHGHTRTLLVVVTARQEVLAAYSNSAWESRRRGGAAEFYGSAQACLFSVDREEGDVRAYKWAGTNRYIQVCDVKRKMLAFGGGGVEGEFGLCVENDFSTGSTGRCETFDNERLCSEDRFEVLNVECWGFMSVFS